MHKVCSPYQSAQTACMKMDCHCRELSSSSSPSIGLLSPLSSLISLASTLSLSLLFACLLFVLTTSLSLACLFVSLSFHSHRLHFVVVSMHLSSLSVLSPLSLFSLSGSLCLSLSFYSHFACLLFCHVCCLSPPQSSAWCIMAVELLRTSMSSLSSIVDWHVHFAGILLVCPSHVTSSCRLPLHSLLFLITVQ